MKKIYKFPYYGAGEANYFEWTFVEIIFKDEPKQEQKNLIEKNVPFPIGEISWEENCMAAGSGQFSHVDIAKAYQTKDGLDPSDKKKLGR